MGFTDTVDDTRVDERIAPAEPGDHERLSHYVPKNELMVAILDGIAVTALCGKTWVPTRDGLQFPVCPECKQIHEGLPLPPGE